ncbi:MAG: cytochrome c oxidase subunit II [Actinobacteria bacterium]|nr:cytochrome c oxidase subunit II [Actinomycetota bacterium]
MIDRSPRRGQGRSTAKRNRALGFGVVVASIAMFASGCVPNAKQDSLNPKSHYAQTIYNLIVPVFILGGIISLIVLGGTMYFSVRYRAKGDLSDDENIPEPVHGNAIMELTWTIIPSLIILVIGGATVITIFKLDKQPPPQNPHIEVIGQQWWWEFRYDLSTTSTESARKYNDIVTANDMVIPAGEDISLRMNSRDVLHGWWVPELQGKRDVVPGRTTMFNVAADKPGTYYGQCTVICGLSHANMRFTVVALSKADYAKWVEHQKQKATVPTSGLAKEGAALFRSQCGMCHDIRGIVTAAPPASSPLVSGAAPDLTHLMTRATFASGTFDLRVNTPRCVAKGLNYADDPTCINSAELRAWIHDPTDMLPMAAGESELKANKVRGMPNLNVSPSGLDQLVAFLETLK